MSTIKLNEIKNIQYRGKTLAANSFNQINETTAELIKGIQKVKREKICVIEGVWYDLYLIEKTYRLIANESREGKVLSIDLRVR